MDTTPQSRLPTAPGHVVVAGGGRLGRQAVGELLRLGVRDLVVIEQYEDRRDELRELYGDGLVTIEGDATEDSVLELARLHEASGLIAALSSPRDNLFLCLAARQMNKSVRIVSRIDESVNPMKFRRVGADALVDPTAMGGQRLAHAMIQPELATLADGLIHSNDRAPILMELPVQKGSRLTRLRLGQCNLDAITGCILIGHRKRRSKYYTYQPGPETRVRAGATILALGEPEELAHLAELLGPDGGGAHDHESDDGTLDEPSGDAGATSERDEAPELPPRLPGK